VSPGDPAAWAYSSALAQYWAPRLRAALASLVDADVLAAAVPHTGAAAAEAARQSAAGALDPRAEKRLADQLATLTADGYGGGSLAAATELRRAGWRDPRPAPGMGMLHAAARRSGWAPGAHLQAAAAAANVPSSVALAALTARVRAAARAIAQTSGQFAARLALRAWRTGARPDPAALRAGLGSAARARRVALTTAVGAINAAAVDAYQANGSPGWQWIATARACPACLLKAAGGPYRFGDPTVPLHPECQCAALPLTAPLSTTAASRGIAALPGLAAPARSGSSRAVQAPAP
jgi:hypothetical protein